MLAEAPLEWLEGRGDLPRTVLSSRIRLARNLRAYPFPGRCGDSLRREAAEALGVLLAPVPLLRDGGRYRIDDLDTLSRQVLVENRQISPEFSRGGEGRFVQVDRRGVLSLMVNEEDHLRIQVVLGGLNLREGWCIARGVHEALGERGFAFDPSLGFLTACPTNLGTGLRASAMLHLPGLEQTGQMEAVVRECQRVGLVVRGAFGEGTEAQGGIFQISNQVTLGPSEEELEDKVSRVARQLAGEERKAREALYEARRRPLEDRVCRAWGCLRHARMLGFREALEQLSLVRLGGELGILPLLDAPAWNHLVAGIQPARLQGLEGRVLPREERVAARADRLRSALGALES